LGKAERGGRAKTARVDASHLFGGGHLKCNQMKGKSRSKISSKNAPPIPRSKPKKKREASPRKSRGGGEQQRKRGIPRRGTVATAKMGKIA